MKIVATIILFYSAVAGAFSGYDVNQEAAPVELQYMVKTLSSYNKLRPQENTDKTDAKLKQLNDLMIHFQKAENYFIFKTETYKAVYEINPGRNFESNGVTFRRTSLEKKYSKYRSDFPFFYFLIYGLFADYEMFRQEKSKQTRLATPWLNFLNENEFEDSIEAMRTFIIQIIDRIIVKFTFYSFGQDSLNKSADLITFSDQKEERPTGGVTTITEKVLKKISDKKAEFTFKNLPISELFPDPDPSYTPPKVLPTPTNDWKN